MHATAAMVLFLAVGITATTGASGEWAKRNSTVGPSRALPVDAREIRGKRLTAEQLHNRVVLLDFWATWCAPCLSELPKLKDLRQRYSRDDFEIVGVMLEPSSRRTLISWLNRHRIDWPQVQERGGYSGELSERFGVTSLPATVLFNREGTVVATGLRGKALAARVDELVAGNTPSVGDKQ